MKRMEGKIEGKDEGKNGKTGQQILDEVTRITI